MFEGTYTALVTPFSKGRLDRSSFQKLIRSQAKGGVDGIVPVGTTGESPTLNTDEHLEIIAEAVKHAGKSLKVIAGTGGNSTNEAVHLTKGAERLGADASLQVSPYYNKPSQEGLFQHFRAVARATKLPIILYSIPGRCNVTIAVETVVRLKKACKNIVAIKEAGGDADRVSQLRNALGPKFTILSGDDALTLPFMSVGASGVISVASNLIPKEISRMVSQYASGKHRAALATHDRLYPLFKALFIETNPVPIKTALALTGQVEPGFRLPLTPMSKENERLLKKALKDVKIKI
ncbi:4-hydroxy-tetrahydrodipicolinate synthase [bacterium]|jgi:4-hydroxy-tetrahydrodipicolinate synthase|nr:4-hydroxy-tetrahydrodipicolinate synthase [bacterium]